MADAELIWDVKLYPVNQEISKNAIRMHTKCLLKHSFTSPLSCCRRETYNIDAVMNIEVLTWAPGFASEPGTKVAQTQSGHGQNHGAI